MTFRINSAEVNLFQTGTGAVKQQKNISDNNSIFLQKSTSQQKIAAGKDDELTKTQAYDENGEIQYRYTDKAGRLVKVVNISSSEKYTYDSQNNLTSKKIFGADGHLISAYEYGYDKENNTKTITRKNSSGVVVGKSLSQFDDKGQEIKNTLFDPDGKELMYTEYGYDEEGQQVRVINRFPDGTEMSMKDYYETMGRLNKLIK